MRGYACDIYDTRWAALHVGGVANSCTGSHCSDQQFATVINGTGGTGNQTPVVDEWLGYIKDSSVLDTYTQDLEINSNKRKSSNLLANY